VGNPLIISGTVKLSRRTLLFGVRKLDSDLLSHVREIDGFRTTAKLYVIYEPCQICQHTVYGNGHNRQQLVPSFGVSFIRKL